MEKLFKVPRKTVMLDYYANKPAREALGEIVEPLEAMIEETVEYALDHKASQETLHRFSMRCIGSNIHGCQQGLLRDPIEMLLERLKPLDSVWRRVELTQESQRLGGLRWSTQITRIGARE